ncbi:MAG: ATP-binding protein [Magnetococcus sp. THC-1_WYH]
MVQATDSPHLPPPAIRPRSQPYLVIFFLIFFPAFVVTTFYDVFDMFVTWVWNDELWYLDELASMLLLCALPFMTYLTYHLFQLNRALRLDEEAMRRLATAVNQTAEMVLITDPSGHVLYVNPAFESVTGYPRHAILGTNVLFFPDDGHNQSLRDKISQAIATGTPFRQRFPAPKHNGHIIHADITWSVVRDEKGKITSHVVVGRDMTRELEWGNHLKKYQKLEAIGTLAGGIAHDFNNILTVILSYTELAMDDLEASSQAHDNLNEVMIAANRAKELIKQLLTFSRRSERKRHPIPLSIPLRKTISLLQAILPEKIILEASLPITENMVSADAARIQQMVMNLCTNAVESMEETGGVLRVALQEIMVDQEMIHNHVPLAKLHPGPHMRLSIQDQGIGIPPANRDRLFEPFFTTKSIGKGSGLGLSVVHGIIQTHEGAITVDSTEGLGSTFQVFLPTVQKTADQSSALTQRS